MKIEFTNKQLEAKLVPGLSNTDQLTHMKALEEIAEWCGGSLYIEGSAINIALGKNLDYYAGPGDMIIEMPNGDFTVFDATEQAELVPTRILDVVASQGVFAHLSEVKVGDPQRFGLWSYTNTASVDAVQGLRRALDGLAERITKLERDR